MFEYRSSSGATFALAGDDSPYWADPDDLRSWEFDYEVANLRVTRFTRDLREVELHISCMAEPGDGRALMEALDRALERDTKTGEPGTLELDGYVMPVFCVGNVLDGDGSFADTEMERTVRFVYAQPEWVREDAFRYEKASEDYDAALAFPFDFAADMQAARLRDMADNDTGAPADIRLDIDGPCTNPAVTVAGNIYEVDVTVPAGATLTIDGRDRTKIPLVLADGSVHNVFANRRRGARGSGAYCFERVPEGALSVEWDNSFSFTLTVYDARGCPPC